MNRKLSKAITPPPTVDLEAHEAGNCRDPCAFCLAESEVYIALCEEEGYNSPEFWDLYEKRIEDVFDKLLGGR